MYVCLQTKKKLNFIELSDIINSLPNSNPLNHGKEVKVVEVLTAIISFLISVIAGMVADFLYNCIRKWLNGRKK